MSRDPASQDQKKRTGVPACPAAGRAGEGDRVLERPERVDPAGAEHRVLAGRPEVTALASSSPCTSVARQVGLQLEHQGREARDDRRGHRRAREVLEADAVGRRDRGGALAGMRESHVDRIPCPGAETSTKSPLVLNGAMLSSGWVAPTPMTPGNDAG